MKKTFWAMALALALAALAAGPGGAAAADYIAAAPQRQDAGGAGGNIEFVFQQVRPCAEEAGYSRAEEDFSVLYLDRAPDSDNEDWENIACQRQPGAAAAGKARLSLGPDKNAPLAGSAAAEARG